MFGFLQRSQDSKEEMILFGEVLYKHLPKSNWKNSGINGIRTQASQILAGCFYQLSYEAARWGRRILSLEKIFNWLGFKTLICFIIFHGVCIVLLLLVGYLIFGIIGLAYLVLYCLCTCLNLSDGDDWEMDHISGLSTEMNLNWINIPLSIAFSLNVLYLINKYGVFISSNLALMRKFTSCQSYQGSVHKLPTWFPLRLLLFEWPAPPLSPPPPHYQSIFHGPPSILCYRLLISPTFSLLKTIWSSQNPSKPTPLPRR